ncbi:MAG: hypothetical protein WC755_07695 [Candidatus Woesearchaeota archaeon]|jgi:hypothetical protein
MYVSIVNIFDNDNEFVQNVIHNDLEIANEIADGIRIRNPNFKVFTESVYVRTTDAKEILREMWEDNHI